jgi:phi13 family phage major tail protein
MAKIGLKYPVYKSATSQGVIAKAIQADISITVNDVKLYADDAVAESDKSFQNGTITLGIDDLSDIIQKEFLGHAVDETTGEVTANGNDQNPYVGIGFYGIKKVNGVKKYRAIWLPKVQFGEPEDTNATKGETVEFNTPVLVGTIMLDDNGDWKKENTFDTEAEAKTYLDEKAGIVVIP